MRIINNLSAGLSPKEPISHEQKSQDFLSMASSSASVSLKDALHADELELALLTGKVPANKEAHLITLLEEAPLWMLQGLVEQVSACCWRRLWA